MKKFFKFTFNSLFDYKVPRANINGNLMCLFEMTFFWLIRLELRGQILLFPFTSFLNKPTNYTQIYIQILMDQALSKVS